MLNSHSPTPLNYSRYVHTPQPPQEVTYETVSNPSIGSGTGNGLQNHHHIIYENLQVVGQRAQPQQPVPQQAQHQKQHSQPPAVLPANLMRATESPLSSSSSPPRPIAPQSYQANVVAPAVATSLKAANHSPQHSKSGSLTGGRLMPAAVAAPGATSATVSSHYQAMRPISMTGSSGGGDIYQNASQQSISRTGSTRQFNPIYAGSNGGGGGGVVVVDDGNNSDYVCMLAGSSMDGGNASAAGHYQPIFGTSASLINDTPVKVQAYKADSVSIQQLPTASTAVAASQPKPPPPAALKKPEAQKPKVNPLAPSDPAMLLQPPQRRTPSLPPSSPTPSNLSSGSGSGRGE